MSDERLATADEVRATAGRVKRDFKVLDPLPRNGLVFRICSLTAGEYSQYSMGAYSKKDVRRIVPSKVEDAERRLFVKVLVDLDGNRLLADHETDIFIDWHAADSQRLHDEIKTFCGIDPDAIEELAKNCGTTTSDDLPSAA